MGPDPLSIGGVLADALAVYRRVWRRSIVVAGLVFAVVGLADALAAQSVTSLTTFVSLLFGLIGGLLVQGMLVLVVRDLRAGREAAPVQELYDGSRERLGTLIGCAFVYGIGVVVGLVLLIVPGLIALARWSLIVPLVMIEKSGWRAAFERSNKLVQGRTGRVLVLIIVTNLITVAISIAVIEAFRFLPAFPAIWLADALGGAVTVPYEALVLTVLYYRLTDPENPVVPGLPTRRRESAWAGSGPDDPA